MRKFIATVLTALAVTFGLSPVQSAVATPEPVSVMTPTDFERASYFPPLGWEHFKYSQICLADYSYGWYPAQISVIVDGLNAGTQRLNVWDAKGGGQCSSHEAGQRLQFALVRAEDSNKYSWCAKTYGATNQYGEWVWSDDYGFAIRVYYNYYKPSCGYNGETGRRNTISGVIAEALGLERYYGGTDYTVMNIDRVNIPWPTTYDYLSLNRVY